MLLTVMDYKKFVRQALLFGKGVPTCWVFPTSFIGFVGLTVNIV